MNRSILTQDHLAPSALKAMAEYHANVVAEVQAAIAKHPVVVVGMAHNPFVKRVRRALQDAGLEVQYLEYGSYFSQWKQRLAIKMWSGWPTFPQVFIKGTLVGGCQDTERLIKSGALKDMLK